MMGHRRKHHRACGVVWDEGTSSPACVRIGQGESAAVSQKLPDNLMVLQSAMRGCLLSDAGAVQYYTGATDRTKKEDGVTPSVLTGADGQVVVEIPLGWLKYWYAGTEHHWMISKEQFNGASRLDAFYKNGSWVKNRYMGAYEGSMYDASAGRMSTDAEAVTNIYAAGDKLCSVTGQCPKTYETRAEFRVMGKERGTGWRQMDYDLASAVQLLYLIEYADFNSQSTIGMGRTELASKSWVVDSYIGRTGKSNSDGNGTNSVGGDTNDAYMTYRGIENFFGNVWKWMDGINTNGSNAYVSNNDSNWADDTSTNYTDLSITLPSSDNYQITLQQISRGFIPATVGGSSSTYICDYYYQDVAGADWRVAELGGIAYQDAMDGVFFLLVAYASSHNNVAIGGRLCF